MKGLAFAVLTAITVAIAGTGPSEAESELGLDSSGSVYVVDEGDTLREIARRFYLDANAYPTIVVGNNAVAAVDRNFQRIENEHDISPGQQIWVPATAHFTEGNEPGEDFEHTVHWDYQGMGSPARWGSLHEDFRSCEGGKQQSPVNIPHDTPATRRELVFDYRPTDLNIVNNGHAIQVNYEDGSKLTVDGVVYELAQFHFHVPSEHTIASVGTSMEMHLVHIADDGRLVVIGILFDEGPEDNPFLEAIWQALPPEGYLLQINQKINVGAAFQQEGPMHHYSGSLTTPPCSEIVEWFVVHRRELMSKEQLGEIVERMGLNSRPIQGLHDRKFK